MEIRLLSRVRPDVAVSACGDGNPATMSGVPGREKVERLSSPHLPAASDDRLKPPSIGGRNSDVNPRVLYTHQTQ